MISFSHLVKEALVNIKMSLAYIDSQYQGRWLLGWLRHLKII